MSEDPARFISLIGVVMTLKQAQEIVDRYNKMWPFTRLTSEQLTEIEKAYKILREKAQQDMFDELGEGRF